MDAREDQLNEKREEQLQRDIEMQRARMGDTMDAIGDRLSPNRMIERRRAAVGQSFRTAKNSIMGSPDYQEPLSSKVRNTTGSLASSAADTAQTALDKAQHAPEAIADQTRGNPIAAGLIAFGAGLLAATVVPPTRTERRAVDAAQPQLQQAKQSLTEAGRDVAAQAKSHAADATEALKSSASESMSSLGDQARDAAQTTRQPR